MRRAFPYALALTAVMMIAGSLGDESLPKLALRGGTELAHPVRHEPESRLAVATAPAPLPMGLETSRSAVTPPSSQPNEEWLARAKREIAEREYHASSNDIGLQAPNRVHRMRVYFEPAGVRVVDRMAEGAPELVTLRTTRTGRDNLSPVGAGQVTSEGARVEIHRPGLVEWYVNSPAGLEHGFTVASPPAGRGPLTIELGVGAARASGSEDEILLETSTGRRLTYGGLVAFDASGVEVPARLEAVDAATLRIVVDDTGARYPLTIDPLLAAQADRTIEANQSDSWFGFSVASAGDVNGDGYSDLIVGAYEYDLGQTDEGAAFLFLGQEILPIWSGQSVNAVYQSNQAFARFGHSVAGAGDVNGDGYDDVLVGSPNYITGQPGYGAAFVFLGKSIGIPSGTPATAATRLRSTGVFPAATSDGLGTGVSGAGDVNGDGYADVIIGAPGAYLGFSNEGAAYVFHGSAAGIPDASAEDAPAKLRSAQLEAQLGFSVGRAGDVNRDGYADVIVGAHLYDNGHSNEGAAFIFHGSAMGIVGSTPAGAATRLESDQAGAAFGSAVAGAGDVNGDGYSDVIVGAHAYDEPENDEGGAFVFLGSAAGVPHANIATASTKIQGDQAGAHLGYHGTVGGAGDVNGDGYADVIVGAYLYDNPEIDEGVAAVFLGSATGVSSGSPQTAAYRLESNQTNWWVGLGVAGAGDVNGDGFGDVLVGAANLTNGQSGEGGALLYLGGPQGIVSGGPAEAAMTFQTNDVEARLESVGAAGDINGDGYADAILGACFYDTGQALPGAAFLFLGSASGLSSTPSSRLHAGTDAPLFGYSVAGAGDVNGDGYADVIVGTYAFSSGQTEEGAAFIFHGSASGIPTGPASGAQTRIEGDQATTGLYGLGWSVAGAGDVNGDGYADVIVGFPSYDDGEVDEGAAFLFTGAPGGIPNGSPATAFRTIQSNQAGAQCGYAVAGIGDANGDGYADFAVGSPAYDYIANASGALFLVHGNASGGTIGGTFVGTLTNERLGFSVAGIGDVDGDGFSDLIAGEPNTNKAYVIAGGAAGFTVTTVLSCSPPGGFGYSVGSAGDVNGDGRPDIVVGAPYYTASGETSEGAMFVYLGAQAGIPSGNQSTASAVLQSNQVEGDLGFCVAGVGDVNGDGFGDVMGVATYYDAGQTDEGAAFLFLGNGGRLGRPDLTTQRRGDASGLRVHPWGYSFANSFISQMVAGDPSGRGRVKLEVELCPPGAAFGSTPCERVESDSWIDAQNGQALVGANIAGLSRLWRWRARALRAPLGVTQPGITPPPNPAHGPWRRPFAQTPEGDIRTAPFQVAVHPQEPADAAFRIVGLHPNPSRGRFALSFTLPLAGDARLEAFDVAGRRMWSRDLGPLALGPHSIDIDRGFDLPAGIYMLRLTQASRTATARMVLSR